jgi:hypothetical protein
MDPQLAQLAQSAGTTVVALLATEAWAATYIGVVALWRRVSPTRAGDAAAAIEETRSDVVLAREQGDTGTEAALATEWYGRLRRLLAADPSAAQELERVLSEARAQLPPGAPSLTGTVRLTAHASGSGRVYQAGRDQHITER